ncbi:MAG TPA: hypothetical protein PKM25_06870 [Candidatus Ozemobacteraceae bacterium]|nr:hypothetical protein [Candidatus Ozemobacteraceae bacterium]
MKTSLISLVTVFLILVLAVGASAGTQMPSVKQQESPYFTGLGFALKSIEDFIPAELRVTVIQLKNLQDGKQSEPSFKAILELGAETYPVKIICPDLYKFEADIMEPQTKGKELSMPIGHITLGVMKVTERKSVATGTLLIKTSNEKGSGAFSLLLNELPAAASAGPGAGSGGASR